MHAVLILLNAVLLGLVYQTQIAEPYAYMGYIPLPLDILSITICGLALLPLVLVYPRRIEQPSDLFVAVYCYGVFLPAILFSAAVEYGDHVTRALLFAALFFPLIALKIILGFGWDGVNPKHLLSPVSFAYSVVPLFMIVGYLAYQQAGDFASWDWEEHYDRRLEGRDVFEAGSPLAYLLSIIGNGLAPLVAFIGTLHRRRILIFFGLGFALFGFFILGVKVQAMLVALAVWLGFLCRRDSEGNFATHILVAGVVICCAALVEHYFFDTLFTSGVIVRRAFVVPGTIHAYFLDYAMQGYAIQEHILRFIGWEYMREYDLSANTVAYLVALGQGGVLGYILCVILTVVILIFIDRIHAGNKEAYCVALLFSALLTTQAITTLLVTSGIGALLLALMLFEGRHLSLTPEPPSR